MRTRTSGTSSSAVFAPYSARISGMRVREIEPPAVGPVSQRFDLADARQPLLQQLVFKGQIGLLRGNKLL